MNCKKSFTLIELLMSLAILSLALTGIYRTFSFVNRSFRLDTQKKIVTRDLQRCSYLLIDIFQKANPSFGDQSGTTVGQVVDISDDSYFYYQQNIDPLNDSESSAQVFDFTHYKSDGSSEIYQGWVLGGNFYLTLQGSYDRKRLLGNIISFDLRCQNKYENEDSGEILLRDANQGTAAPANHFSVGSILQLNIECLTDTGLEPEKEKLVVQSFKVNMKIPSVPVN